MKRKLKTAIKIPAINIAVSFFFASIFIVLSYFFLDKKIDYYSTIVNKTTISEGKTVQAVFDSDSKRIIELPSWGSKFADLKIPSIDLDLPVYHGDNMKILRLGIGHYAGSYFPGEDGSIILAGHNNPGIFDRLDELDVGDKIMVKANYGSFTYEVSDKKVVEETDLDAFPVEHEYELLVLYTCWPIDGTFSRRTERLVIYATKVGENYE